ncbi:hypothetical protein Ccrd_012781 [Cynara cardunculus var. scolymus]|uniref:Bifunctional inhibitor/plant lipid transfer protein/seed storage helical domain-containing protein n=1 Tax=Cynara cardunculus var. scolymus TaxID=59895 RepID=A0A103YGV1_CYNCS|nr:hypothetical protein Ccrd_012781 [Cynara cardunculus var. scolymus]
MDLEGSNEFVSSILSFDRDDDDDTSNYPWNSGGELQLHGTCAVCGCNLVIASTVGRLMREQRPCFCGYLRNPSLRQFVSPATAKRVASQCGVSIPQC